MLFKNLFKSKTNHDPHKKAILVYQNNENYSAVKLMEKLLKENRYHLFIVNPTKNTKDDLFETIDSVVSNSDECSKTIFYYTGHGSELKGFYEGIFVNGDSNYDYGNRINPYELYTRLGKIKGKKAVLIDACLSGVFVDYLKTDHLGVDKLINNYVVLAASPKDSLTFSLRGVGYMTQKLYDTIRLMSKDGAFNLSDIIISSESEETILQRKKAEEIISEKFGRKTSLEIQGTYDTDFIL